MSPRKARLAGKVGQADSILRTITGMGISDYAQIALKSIQNKMEKSIMTPEEEEDLMDCLVFGAENFISENVFKSAVNIFRKEHHPDRHNNPIAKKEHEQLFKQGEKAAVRISQRRGWKKV